MRIVETIEQMRELRQEWIGAGSVGFVPTMGYLHAGHLSLVRECHAENTCTVVSIFVNPTQFGPNEDLSRYPRNLPRDLELLQAANVDAVFVPAAAEMYPSGFSTYVDPTGSVAQRLEAASRPGHFRGVATVVAKLLQIVQPEQVYFGQKDAQQVAVIRHMVRDFDFPVALRVLPTLREADGLAMSSRNSYLSPDDRAAATVLARALNAGREVFVSQPLDGPEGVVRAMHEVIQREPRATLDYADVCDPDTFEPLTELRRPALLAVAARVGPARLIDNYLLDEDGVWNIGIRLTPETQE